MTREETTGPALSHLLNRIRQLESVPTMRKGALIEAVILDATIPWTTLFHELAMRGRHRRKLRWRRTVVHAQLRRVFPRGGARLRSSSAATENHPNLPPVSNDRDAIPSPPHCADLPCLPLKTAPWYVIQVLAQREPVTDVRELEDFDPLETWDRFRQVFPVLAVYRAGWNGSCCPLSLSLCHPFLSPYASPPPLPV
jgi:hypothetical protein